MPMSMREGQQFFAQVAIAIPGATAATLERAAEMVEEEAKHVIGTYDYDWPQLALSTQLQREQLGFNPNDPLLRTGELRDSIQHSVDEEAGVAYVGSNNPIAKWQELGTKTIPARSFLGGAAKAKEHEIVEMTGRAFYKVITGSPLDSTTSFLEEVTRYIRLGYNRLPGNP